MVWRCSATCSTCSDGSDVKVPSGLRKGGKDPICLDEVFANLLKVFHTSLVGVCAFRVDVAAPHAALLAEVMANLRAFLAWWYVVVAVRTSSGSLLLFALFTSLRALLLLLNAFLQASSHPNCCSGGGRWEIVCGSLRIMLASSAASWSALVTISVVKSPLTMSVAFDSMIAVKFSQSLGVAFWLGANCFSCGARREDIVSGRVS